MSLKAAVPNARLRSVTPGFLTGVDSFVTTIDSANNKDEVFTTLQGFTENLGFEYFAYELFCNPASNQNPILATSYPKDWTEQYIQNRYCRDDVVCRFSMQQVTPFLWNDLLQRQKLTDRQTLVMQEGGEAGLKSGASVPIHGPGALKGYLVIANSCNDTEFDKLFEHRRHELQIAATYAHEKVVAYLKSEHVAAAAKLTPREIEILTWTALGKTSWEISEILKMAHSTVRKHIDNVCQKLDVSNKTHAVAIGLMNGIIAL